MYVWPYIGIIAFVIALFAFFEWYAKSVFLARGYPRKYGHGKSWKRARKHYKTNWTFIQRMLWVFVFKEVYSSEYRMMAYMSYIHSIFAFVTISCFLLNEFLLSNFVFWQYIFVAYGIFTLIRYIHDNAIATAK